jgi:hypothetical protein
MSVPTNSPRPSLKIVVVGHVDHGKSTVVGRLMHQTDSRPEGKFEAIRQMSTRRGMPFEWAFLMDALQAERDQGIASNHLPARCASNLIFGLRAGRPASATRSQPGALALWRDRPNDRRWDIT